MSVNPSQTRFYGSANMPDADGATTGGAVDFANKVVFSDISPAGTMDYVSSNNSDTGVILTLTGRDSTGAIVSEAKTLTGQTAVAGSQTFSRLLKCLATGSTALGTVAALSHTALIASHTAQAAANSSGVTPATITLQAGDGATAVPGTIIRILNNTPTGVQYQLKEVIDNSSYGTDVVAVDSDWSTVPSSSTTYSVFEGMLFNLTPNQITQVRRPFYNAAAAAAGGSTTTYYEKIFAVNNNTSIALTVASILKTVDPSSGTFEFALTNTLNDTGTVANRQTAPATGITAFTTGAAPQSINVPSPQNLPSGAAPNAAGAQGVWLQLALTAGLAPANTSFTMEIAGQTI